jgi:hypothetical protein
MAVHEAPRDGLDGRNPDTPAIIISPPLVTIAHPITLDVPDTAARLEELPGPDRLPELRRILELGTQTAATISTSTTLRMVEAQMVTMTQELAGSIGTLLTDDRASAQTLLKGLLDEHREKVTSAVGRYLDPESQASLPVAMANVFDQASKSLLTRVEALLSEGDDSALGRLADRFTAELGRSTALIIEQLAARHALTTQSSLAGRPYEDDLEERLVALARPLGDQVVRCGDTPGIVRRKSGDILITIAPEMVGGRNDVRIAVEAKRRGATSRAFSPAEIKKQLADARANRGADAGLFVSETASALPLGLGFHEYGSSDIAVAWDSTADDTGLAVAYRLLRGVLVVASREASGDEIDRESHQRVVADIRESITKLDAARSQHQAAINSINRAGVAIGDVRDAVVRGLRELDELVGAA